MKLTASNFSRGLVGCLILFFTAGAASSQPPSSQPLSVTGVQPAAGGPGDAVQIRGQGFGQPARSYFASVFGSDRGIVLEVTGKSSSTRLDAEVGEVQADVTGDVVLWRGQRSSVAPFDIGNGRFAVRDAVVFRPTSAARGSSFTATAGTAPGASGRLVDGDIHIGPTSPSSPPMGSESSDEDDEEEEDVAEKPDGKEPPVGDIVYEGSGESCGPPDGGSGSGFTAEGFGVSLRIECRDQQVCRGRPAALLAEALEGVLGEFGIEATVQGDGVVLSHDQPFCKAAANATRSPVTP